jgi:hypothetical protein
LATLRRFGSALGPGAAIGDPDVSGDAAFEAAVAASDGATLAPALPLLVPPEHPATANRKISPIDCARIGHSYRTAVESPFSQRSRRCAQDKNRAAVKALAWPIAPRLSMRVRADRRVIDSAGAIDQRSDLPEPERNFYESDS